MLYVISTNTIKYHLGPYFCSKSGCLWKDFTEGVDWGYYSNHTGDCEFCRNQCQEDTVCTAFECGSTYCSWWVAGTCDNMSKDTNWNTTLPNGSEYKTCRILGNSIEPFLYINRMVL